MAPSGTSTSDPATLRLLSIDHEEEFPTAPHLDLRDSAQEHLLGTRTSLLIVAKLDETATHREAARGE